MILRLDLPGVLLFHPPLQIAHSPKDSLESFFLLISLQKSLFSLITLPLSLRSASAVLIHRQVQSLMLQKTKGSDQN